MMAKLSSLAIAGDKLPLIVLSLVLRIGEARTTAVQHSERDGRGRG